MNSSSTFGSLKTGTAFAALAVGLSISPPTANPISTNSLVKTQSRSATAFINDGRRFLIGTSTSTYNPYFEQNSNPIIRGEVDRQTSEKEKLIGEIRSWSAFTADWDGEGSSIPNQLSLEEATNFIRLLPDTVDVEPMLNANGRAGLYWNIHNFYADLEFLGDGRIAYFIQKSDDKHKGLLHFDSKSMPSVLSILLTFDQSA